MRICPGVLQTNIFFGPLHRWKINLRVLEVQLNFLLPRNKNTNTIRLAGDRSKFDLITLWPSFITTQNISEWISFYWTQSMKGVWVRNLLAVILTLLWKKSHLSWLNQNAAYCIGITAICSRSHCLRISAWDGVRSALLSKDHHWQHLQPSPQKAGLHSKLL